MNSDINCYCQSGLTFKQCCQPFIHYEQIAPTAEHLMRSRFSAYVLQNYAYILKTYGAKQRQSLSIQDLQQSTANIKWLRLKVVKHQQKYHSAQVEFKAYYQDDSDFFVMHELSDFEQVNEQWFYTTGTMLQSTGQYQQQRNASCLCNSGKKFKKCCGK